MFSDDYRIRGFFIRTVKKSRARLCRYEWFFCLVPKCCGGLNRHRTKKSRSQAAQTRLLYPRMLCRRDRNTCLQTGCAWLRMAALFSWLMFGEELRAWAEDRSRASAMINLPRFLWGCPVGAQSEHRVRSFLLRFHPLSANVCSRQQEYLHGYISKVFPSFTCHPISDFAGSFGDWTTIMEMHLVPHE